MKTTTNVEEALLAKKQGRTVSALTKNADISRYVHSVESGYVYYSTHESFKLQKMQVSRVIRFSII